MRIKQRFLQWFVLAILIIYGLSFIHPIRGFFIQITNPIVQVVRHGGESVITSFEVIGSIPHLSKDNEQLQARVNELASIEVTNTELRHENELLRKELDLLPDNGKRVLAAQVVSRSASVSQQFITLNKGQADGFTSGMAIIAQGYFIGRIGDVWEHSSQVVLITSAESLVPVVLQDSRSVGLLRGGAEGLVVEDIPRDVAINVQEAIVTSNIGDIIKSGIPIGTVSAILSNKSDVFQSIRINSPVDFSRLEIVFGVQ